MAGESGTKSAIEEGGLEMTIEAAKEGGVEMTYQIEGRLLEVCNCEVRVRWRAYPTLYLRKWLKSS